MLCNEERWCWYSIMSVINYVDHMIIYDTGSTDNTVKIVKEILQMPKYKDKVIFEEKGKVEREEFVRLRDEMVQRTKDDYFMIVDGDEIHYEEQMKKLRSALDSDEDYEVGIIGFICCAGDAKHYRNPLMEHYCYDRKEGALAHRVTSMHIEGIHCGSKDGKWDGFYDNNENYVVPGNGYRTYWADGFYLHMSNMLRSSSLKKDMEVGWPSERWNKYLKRSTWDAKFPKNFKYPEVFYQEHPIIVQDAFARDPGIQRWMLQFAKNIVLLFRRPRVKIDKFDASACYLEKGKNYNK